MGHVTYQAGQLASEGFRLLPRCEVAAGWQLSPTHDLEEAFGELSWCRHQVLRKDRDSSWHGHLAIFAGIVLDVGQERGANGVRDPIEGEPGEHAHPG